MLAVRVYVVTTGLPNTKRNIYCFDYIGQQELAIFTDRKRVMGAVKFT